MTEDTGSGRGLRHIYYQFVICPPPSSSPMILISCSMCTQFSPLKTFNKKYFLLQGNIFYIENYFSSLRLDICKSGKYFILIFYFYFSPFLGTYFHLFSETHCGKKCISCSISCLEKTLVHVFSIFVV